jgi:alpha-amylase
MDTSFRDFFRCAAEPVAEFACARYEACIERPGSEPTVRLHRSSGPVEPTLSVSKAIALHPMASLFSVTHTVQNDSEKTIALVFGSETNVAFQSGSGPGRGYFSRDVKFEKDSPGSSGVVEEICHVGLRDEYLGVAYECNYGEPAVLWRFPVETVSQSESGQERGYQSSVLFPNWRIELEPQEQWSVAVEHSIHNL